MILLEGNPLLAILLFLPYMDHLLLPLLLLFHRDLCLGFFFLCLGIREFLEVHESRSSSPDDQMLVDSQNPDVVLDGGQ